MSSHWIPLLLDAVCKALVPTSIQRRCSAYPDYLDLNTFAISLTGAHGNIA